MNITLCILHFAKVTVQILLGSSSSTYLVNVKLNSQKNLKKKKTSIKMLSTSLFPECLELLDSSLPVFVYVGYIWTPILCQLSYFHANLNQFINVIILNTSMYLHE